MLFMVFLVFTGFHAGTGRASDEDSGSLYGVHRTTSFLHQYLTLSLPYGWIIDDLPTHLGDNVIARFRTRLFSGAINVYCYRDPEDSFQTIRQAARKILELGYPVEKKQLKKPQTVRTDGGRSAIVEVWQGVFPAAGKSYLMQSPLAIMKTRHCWLLMIGYTGDAGGQQLEQEFIEILRTAQ